MSSNAELPMGRGTILYGAARRSSDELRREKRHPDTLVGLCRSPTKLSPWADLLYKK